jgi:8-oxo-dGTP pyrophosphatase MutT (NUDIX family)
MSLIDRFHHCSLPDLGGFRPWSINGRTIGWLRPDVAEALQRFPSVFLVDDESITLQAHLDSFDYRSAAIGEVARALLEMGIVQGWRNEAFAVAAQYGETPLFRLERAAVPVFGVRAYGVHLNGFVRMPDGIKLWVGWRADNRPVEPGKLDNMVAGGLPYGLDPMSNLIKEAAEEAGITAEIARQARPAGAISYRMLHEGLLRRDTLFIYDLEVPPAFQPTNTDGEIAAFRLMSLDEVTGILRDSEAFKFNVAPVVIDFLVRHGHLTPETPGYVDLAMGLTAFLPDDA